MSNAGEVWDRGPRAKGEAAEGPPVPKPLVLAAGQTAWWLSSCSAGGELAVLITRETACLVRAFCFK